MTSTAYRTIPGADRTFSSVSLYFQVARLMVEVHQISPQLAAYHAFQMEEAELNHRLRMYAEMELSVVDPNPTAVNESSTRFSRPQRRRQVDGTQLHSRSDAEVVSEFEYCIPWFRRIVAEAEALKSLPESGKEEPGPKAGAVLAPAAARVGNRKPGNSGRAARLISGEGFCF